MILTPSKKPNEHVTALLRQKENRDQAEKENPPHFLLTPAGATLLDTFLKQDMRFWRIRSDELTEEAESGALSRSILIIFAEFIQESDLVTLLQ